MASDELAPPPCGPRRRATKSWLPTLREWKLDSGHSHPDAGSFIVWANGRYLTGDTGYAGLPSARNHNTMTFGGIGQGVDTRHDVWRQMDYVGLNRLRIREADLGGGKARIVADLAAAYSPAAGVAEFTRVFNWNGADAITIADTVTLKAPRAAEWFLQSDTPLTGTGTRFRNGLPQEAGVQVTFEQPKDVMVTSGPATVKAPGAPGSIEKGAEEERGHVLKATTAPASSIRFDVRLEILAGGKAVKR